VSTSSSLFCHSETTWRKHLHRIHLPHPHSCLFLILFISILFFPYSIDNTYGQESSKESSAKVSSEEGLKEVFEKGISFLREGKLDSAEAVFNTVLKREPDHAMAHFRLGEIYLSQGRLNEAINHLDRAIKIAPPMGSAGLRLAEAYERMAHFRLGKIYLSQGRLDEAINHLDRAIKIAPPMGSAGLRLAEAYERKGELKNAIQTLEAVLSETDDTTAELAGLVSTGLERLRRLEMIRSKTREGIALFRSEESEAAEKAFREVLSVQAENPEIHRLLGVVLGKEGRFDEAIDHFKTSLLLKPDLLESRKVLADLYILQDNAKLNEPKVGLSLARAELEKAQLFLDDQDGPIAESIEAKLRDIEDQIEIAALTKRWTQQDHNKDIAAAMATLQEIVKIDPDHVIAYFNLANLAAQKTQYDQAEAFLKRAIEVNPEYTEAYQRLGQVYEVTRLFELATEQYEKGLATQGGKLPPMKEGLEQSIERSEAGRRQAIPAAEAAFQKGSKALEDGIFDEAIAMFEQAAFFNPKDPETRFLLAILYERKDRLDLANLTLRLIIGTHPAHVEAHRRLARLDEKEGFFYQALKRWKLHGESREVLARLQKKVREIEEKTGPLMTQAREEAEAGNLLGAIETLKKAREHALDDPRIRLLLGRFYTRVSMKKEALDAFNTAGFFESSDGQASYYLGELYVTGNQWEQARLHYDNALASEEISETLRMKGEKARSRVIRNQRNFKTAERFFNRARRAHIDENYHVALAGYQKALAFFPSDISSLYQSATVYENLNRFDEAKKTYLKAIQVSPNHIASNRRLGILYEADGQHEEAIRYYRHYLSLWRGQENAETLWVKERLKPLEKRFHVTVNQVVLSYDSNPNQSSNPVPDFRSNLGIGFTYLLRKNRSLQIPINISTNNIFFFRSNTVFSQETFRISAIRASQPFLYSISYNFQYGLARGGPTGSNHVGSFNLTRFSKKASSVAFGYIFDTFISEQDRDFDATRHTVRLTYNKRWGEKSGSVWYRFFDNGSKFNDQASMSNGVGFSYDWIPMNKIATSFSYSVNSIQFDHIDSLGNKRRENLLHSVSFSATYRLQKGTMLSASVIEQLNDSNLPAGGDEVTLEQQLSGQAASLGDYSQRILSMNIAWSF